MAGTSQEEFFFLKPGIQVQEDLLTEGCLFQGWGFHTCVLVLKGCEHHGWEAEEGWAALPS